MSNPWQFLLLGGLLAGIVPFAFGQSSCHLREMDLCAASLAVLAQGLPTTQSEMTKHCGYIREAEGCFRNYTTRCATRQQRELIDTIAQSAITNLVNDMCTPGTELQRSFLKHASCLNSVQRQQRVCFKDVQSALEVVTTTEWNKRIPAGCCTLRRWTVRTKFKLN